MFSTVNELLPYIQIIAGFATGLGFIFTFLTFRRIRTTEQVKLAEKIQENILALDQELSQIDKEDEEIILVGFQTRQYVGVYSFLVNKKQIKDKTMQEYFKDGLITDYRDIFLAYANEDTKNDPNQYPEFKKLYEKLTK